MGQSLYSWDENAASWRLPKIEPGDKVFLQLREGDHLRRAKALVSESESVSCMLTLDVEAVFDGERRLEGHPLEGEEIALPNSCVHGIAEKSE